MRNHVAFIDSGVEDLASLISGMRDNVEAIVLNARQPALEQIVSVLRDRKAVDGLHIFAHGSTGSIEFSAGTLALDGIDNLDGINGHLNDGATVHLWTCETGAGAAGHAFIAALSDGFGRPVAASSSRVGAAHLGGSWVLDRTTGAAAFASPLTTHAMSAYAGVFANDFATTGVDNITQMSGADTLTVTNTNQIQATDFFNGGAGIDTILFDAVSGANIDFSVGGPVFNSYEALNFNNSSGLSSATFSASQFGSGLISASLAVNGNSGLHAIAINNASNFSAANWTFTSWLSGSDTLTINGTSGSDTITGSSQADTINGGDGNDTLDGGAGNDTMVGGIGDDVYVLDSAGDVATENASQGTDTVAAGFSYTLGANFENLVLTGDSAVDGTGNAIANIIVGNSATNNLMGGAGNDTLDGGTGADNMSGGTENDTYVVDDAGDVVTELLNEGNDTVESFISYTLGENVENLTLSGFDEINATGNAGANVLTGNSAANVIDGGAGADTMAGGDGDDAYVVDDAGDVISENANEGNDSVQSSVSYVLSANVENLTLTGSALIDATGNDSDNVLTGNDAFNVLNGGNGNDTLDGGVGADSMTGGDGDDTYIVDGLSDTITENANEGSDTVQAGITFTLATDFENLTLTGTASVNGTGNSANNVLTGNSAANNLSGLDGDDTLDGGGGSDRMTGGTGNDTYVVNAAGDVVTELLDEGIDTVQSSVNYLLSTHLEHLTLLGTGSINGTGNAFDNIMTGNSGANTLNGGAGADTLAGGAGNDTYVVDNAADSVTELAGQGTDTVQANLTYTIADHIENLTLTGVSAIDGTGNSADNIMIGNGAINTLTALGGNDTLNGGAGADILIGGAGNDTYVVENTGDVTTENANEGTDLVQSSVTYSLAGDLENLALTGGGTIDGTGNVLDNVITGNSAVNNLVGGGGNDTLNGGGGADAMSGGTGDDTYFVENAGDTISESLNQGTDTVNSAITFTLTPNVENLTLTGGAAINAVGNILANVLNGNSGANVINGGSGADTMTGGLGNDSYVIDNVGDIVNESAGAGTDSITVNYTYTLLTNFENLTLSGVLAIDGSGNSVNNYIRGNSANNSLYGLGGTDTLSGLGGDDTMYGGTGNDVYIVDSAGDVTVENANEGTDIVQTALSHALAANVENLTLTGAGAVDGTGNSVNNVITGNSGANTLSGMGGNDTLNGGLGADNLIGGTGNDTYYVDNVGDTVTENAGEGTDNVQSSVTFTLGANVDNLTLTGGALINGTGNADANTLIGNSAANTLNGGDGHDSLNGGTGNDTLNGGSGNDLLTGAAGNDTMSGGAGDDTYVVDALGDVIVENANEGTDTVQSSLTSTLASDFENLTLTGSAVINGTGNGLDNVIIGNSAINVLSGLGGNDTLNGGVGADSMTGGTGNDTYVVDNLGDTVSENAGEGTDLVQSSVTHTLSADVENLTLTGTAAINGTGNASDNIILGTSMANALTGLGGDDRLDGGGNADTMTGGTGDDTYVVDNTGDVVVENASEGTDTVESRVAYVLSANLENLTLTGSGITNGTGNAGSNVIIGNSASNTLNGLAGADSMSGGDGNDTYVVDDLGDVVNENASEGTDLVQSGVSFTLSNDVENLTLTGSASIDGTGNTLNNTITGNSGLNILSGGAGNDNLNGGANSDLVYGGSGADLLTGGTDSDTFLFAFITDSGVDTDRDAITDFATGDLIDLSLIDADVDAANDQAFVIDTDNSFSKGEIKIQFSLGNAIVSLNNDNDAEADMVFLVQNTNSLTGVDFVL
jgi:Ca2+-binding RTX toxin-like protein